MSEKGEKSEDGCGREKCTREEKSKIAKKTINQSSNIIEGNNTQSPIMAHSNNKVERDRTERNMKRDG
jgi:hypothetical protein